MAPPCSMWDFSCSNVFVSYVALHSSLQVSSGWQVWTAGRPVECLDLEYDSVFSSWNKQGRTLAGTYRCRSIIVAVTGVFVTHTVGPIRLLNFGLVTVQMVLFLFQKLFEMLTNMAKGQFSACFFFLCPNLSAFLSLTPTFHNIPSRVAPVSTSFKCVAGFKCRIYKRILSLFSFELMITFCLFMFYRAFQLFGIWKQIAVVLFLNCSQRRQHVRLASRHHVAPTLLPLCVRSHT